MGILTYLYFERKMLFQSKTCFIKKYPLLKLFLLNLFADKCICSYLLPCFPTAPHLLLPKLTIITISHIYSSCSQGRSHLGDSACAACADGSPAPRCRMHLQRPGRKASLEAAAHFERGQSREERALFLVSFVSQQCRLQS